MPRSHMENFYYNFFWFLFNITYAPNICRFYLDNYKLFFLPRNWKMCHEFHQPSRVIMLNNITCLIKKMSIDELDVTILFINSLVLYKRAAWGCVNTCILGWNSDGCCFYPASIGNFSAELYLVTANVHNYHTFN